ncbi:hypothetical protein EMIT0111MI5_20433 [Burkholderia sp. IT-111MI5]
MSRCQPSTTRLLNSSCRKDALRTCFATSFRLWQVQTGKVKNTCCRSEKYNDHAQIVVDLSSTKENREWDISAWTLFRGMFLPHLFEVKCHRTQLMSESKMDHAAVDYSVAAILPSNVPMLMSNRQASINRPAPRTK